MFALTTNSASGNEQLMHQIGHRQIKVPSTFHPNSREAEHPVNQRIDLGPFQSSHVALSHAREKTDQHDISLNVARKLLCRPVKVGKPIVRNNPGSPPQLMPPLFKTTPAHRIDG